MSRSNLAEGGETARVALDHQDAARPSGEQSPRQSPRTGSDLDDRRMLERPRGASDPAGQIEIEKKILPEAFACNDAVPSDHLAQRRQGGRRWIALQLPAERLTAISAASRSAAIRLSGRAIPRPAIVSAVP